MLQKDCHHFDIFTVVTTLCC